MYVIWHHHPVLNFIIQFSKLRIYLVSHNYIALELSQFFIAIFDCIDKDFTKWIIWSFTFLFLMIHTTKLCCNGHICKIMITYLCTYLLLCISYIHTYCPKAITKSGSEFWKMFDCSIHQSKFKLLLHSHTIFLI